MMNMMGFSDFVRAISSMVGAGDAISWLASVNKTDTQYAVAAGPCSSSPPPPRSYRGSSVFQRRRS